MTVRAYYVEALALQQLETALRLFAEGVDYASVITLAGAADEIFGKRLQAIGRESSLRDMIKAVRAIQCKLFGEANEDSDIAWRANHARNKLKHWGDGDQEIIRHDLEQEAFDMVNRAIDNYWMLRETPTPAMEEFQRAARGKK